MNEDLLNVMGNFVETELDYIENCEKEKLELEKQNKDLKDNWNKLKEWLEERKFVYNITGEDLDEDTSITEVLVKMCEIEKGGMNE